MKTLTELQQESDFHWEEHGRLLNEIFHHPDYIAHWFEKLKLDDACDEIMGLISRVGVIHSHYGGFSYTFDSKNYYMEYTNYDRKIHWLNFYFDGKKENSSDYNDYKEKSYKHSERISNEARSIIAKYISSKKENQYLNKLIQQSKLDDCVLIGILLVICDTLR